MKRVADFAAGTLKPLHSITLMSAGILSPNLISTTSPRVSSYIYDDEEEESITFEMLSMLKKWRIWSSPLPSQWSSHHSSWRQRIVGQGSWIPPWSWLTLTPAKRKIEATIMLRKRCCLVVGENASDSDDSRKHDSEVEVVIRGLLVGACLLCYRC